MTNTSKIFKKHFGDTASVGLNHPNIENFFEELNQDCLREDAEKTATTPEEKQVEFVPEFFKTGYGMSIKTLPNNRALFVDLDDNAAGIIKFTPVELRVTKRSNCACTPAEFYAALRQAQETINKAALL